jgi:hypothetical protein
VREDLGFRFLAGGATPDHKTLSEFHRRHARAIRQLFAQMLGLLRSSGLARVGTVAIDSTRVGANASRQRVLRAAELERKVAEWQQHVDDDPDRTPGTRVGQEQIERVREQLQRVRESGQSRLSETDPEARFVRTHDRGFQLGYTAEIAVSEDHFIVTERVTQRRRTIRRWCRWSMPSPPTAARRRRQCWPTPGFPARAIWKRWRRAASTPTFPTPI